MIIYKISSKEGYLELQFKNYDSDKILVDLLVEEKSVLKEWGVPEVEIITKGKKSDCPFFWVSSQLVVVSENAKDELYDVWEADNIELLPMKYNNDIYYMVHIMQIENISYKVDDEYRKIFNKDECEEHKVMDRFLFRAYDESFEDIRIFATDKFIERIQNSNLKGFAFEKIWEE